MLQLIMLVVAYKSGSKFNKTRVTNLGLTTATPTSEVVFPPWNILSHIQSWHMRRMWRGAALSLSLIGADITSIYCTHKFKFFKYYFQLIIECCVYLVYLRQWTMFNVKFCHMPNFTSLVLMKKCQKKK